MADEEDSRYEQMDHTAVEVFLDFVKGASERQVGAAEALDTKIVQIFGAASVVIGLAGFSSASGTTSASPAAVALLSLGLLAYAATAYAAYTHLKPKPFYRPDPDLLWQELWDLPVEDLRHSLVQRVVTDFEHNKPLLDAKANTISYALAFAAVEVGLVVLALIVRGAA